MSVELICNEKRKARKVHVCDYCGGTILPGEEYDHGALKYEGTIYNWKSHLKCKFIAKELWTMIDPDEGMTAEEFDEGCVDFCQTFICPDCEHHHDELGCGQALSYCIDRIYDKLQTHKVVMTRDTYGFFCFKLIKREDHHGI